MTVSSPKRSMKWFMAIKNHIITSLLVHVILPRSHRMKGCIPVWILRMFTISIILFIQSLSSLSLPSLKNRPPGLVMIYFILLSYPLLVKASKLRLLQLRRLVNQLTKRCKTGGWLLLYIYIWIYIIMSGYCRFCLWKINTAKHTGCAQRKWINLIGKIMGGKRV